MFNVLEYVYAPRSVDWGKTSEGAARMLLHVFMRSPKKNQTS